MRRVNEIESDTELLDEYDFSKLNLQRCNYAVRTFDHKFTIKVSCEKNGTWLADIPAFGVQWHGSTREEAISKVQGLAFRVLADRLADGKSVFGASIISFPCLNRAHTLPT
jgi:predicted RNase H-like HicB family nuclease